jgi:PAS domain S-box-containing protein
VNRDEQSRADLEHQEAEAVLKRLAGPLAQAPAPSPGNGTPTSDPLPARQAVAEFAWTESALRSLLEALPDAMLLIDRDGVIRHVNTPAERLFGYQRTELVGATIELLVPERLRAAHVAHRARYFADPRVRPMGSGLELYGRHRSGHEIPVEISLSPLRTEGGVFAISMIRDITARKQEEARFRTLVENIPAVTFFAPLDESSPELYVSPQIEALLGFSREEWLSDPVLWFRQLHPDDQPRWSSQFAPTCAAGDAFREVYRFIAKDGHVVWVHGAANLVRDHDGAPLFLQGVAFDITEQKRHAEQLQQAEAELRRINAELEQRVVERTAALEQSLAALGEKSGELEQFAYVSSHDLRQPLRSLINYPQKLVQEYADRLDERGLDWLGKTISGAERMRRLIDDLLQYSRVLRQERTAEEVDCQELLQIVCANLQADLEQTGAEVHSAGLPVVRGSRSHLIVLFQNLIGNAVKFRAADRPPRVQVDAAPAGAEWQFRVQDNGIGIEEKYLKRIFDLGERLHSEKKYPGTGFGLAICEKIVRNHGGQIWAESEPDRGSAFCFTLPGASSR